MDASEHSAAERSTSQPFSHLGPPSAADLRQDAATVKGILRNSGRRTDEVLSRQRPVQDVSRLALKDELDDLRAADHLVSVAVRGSQLPRRLLLTGRRVTALREGLLRAAAGPGPLVRPEARTWISELARTELDPSHVLLSRSRQDRGPASMAVVDALAIQRRAAAERWRAKLLSLDLLMVLVLSLVVTASLMIDPGLLQGCLQSNDTVLCPVGVTSATLSVATLLGLGGLGGLLAALWTVLTQSLLPTPAVLVRGALFATVVGAAGSVVLVFITQAQKVLVFGSAESAGAAGLVAGAALSAVTARPVLHRLLLTGGGKGQMLEAVGDTVSRAVRQTATDVLPDAVRTGLQTALAGNRVPPFSGEIAVLHVDRDGVESGARPLEDGSEVAAGRSVELLVVLTATRTPAPGTIPVLVGDPKSPLERAPRLFMLHVDIGEGGPGPRQYELTVAQDSPSTPVRVVFERPPTLERSRLWLRLASEGRTIQSASFDVLWR